MPRIKTVYAGSWKAPLSYSVRESKFYIVLPGELLRYADFKGRIWGDTERDIQGNFNRIARKHIEEGARREKVILIDVEKGDLDGFSSNNDIQRAGGESGGLELQFVVLSRVMVNDRWVYYGKDGRKFWHAEDSTVIPWTQEREEVLKRTIKAMQGLAGNVERFFGADDLVGKIDARVLPPLLTDRSER